jgi:transcriptional regulator with PAS, ATPase and Fis domain
MIDPTKTKDFYKTLLDKMQIGIIVADAHGIVIYINETYARFLNIRIEESLGKHATEIVANTRLHIVAETGQAEINYPHKFQDIGYLVHRIPIKKDERVIAVMGLVLFDRATTAVKLAEKLVYLETKLKVAQGELASLHAIRYSFADIIAVSPAMEKVKEQAIKAAHSNLSVLITGESGTGKELFAQSIHRESSRKPYPFVRVNCAAIPKELFESELFGYEKGAFTGALSKGKAGKFEVAHLGTIFLDEVGDMPMELQPKLLRVLELKEFERVGGNRVISSDFRVIAATNLDLEKAMENGAFRRDLYYRLNGIPLHITPLRSRREDIGCLAEHFLQRIVSDKSRQNIHLDPAATRQLQAYSWPGNGRELLHVLERAVFAMSGDTITPLDLPEYTQTSLPPPPQRENRQSLKAYMRAAEKHAIEHVLKEADQNKTTAAQILGVHRTLLYRKMQQLGMLDPA